MQLLKNEYNIEVETALYLVDRSVDRKTLALEKIGLADPSVTQGTCARVRAVGEPFPFCYRSMKVYNY